ncbi:MAG: cobyrinate a,c-diamide synthase [Deltaproteobacteria bacterium]|nr:cobyrinate a,c-diamide synthase [Deltaproteobacteria bacterium]
MTYRKRCPGLVIAAPSSGSGKTFVTLGMMEALRRRGKSVAPFKAGPDYIDAGLHAALLGVPSYNLDTWMMGGRAVKKTFASKAGRADMAIVEGVMGLYDGKDGEGEAGSTGHLAKVLNLPVCLVVNAKKMARSAGALVTGFAAFDRAIDLRWVIFNKAGSARHFETLRASIPARLRVRCLGYIPRDAGLAMPERHLGLASSGDMGTEAWRGFIEKAGDAAEKFIDLDVILSALPKTSPRQSEDAPVKGRVKLGVALDPAFSFYYQENLDLLRRFGAEPVFFSPIKDNALPDGISGLYLGGGYPELHARPLAANQRMRGAIRRYAELGLPIFAECGGLMYLGEGIEDKKGRAHDMSGVFPWTTRMLDRRASLGYREVEAAKGCPMLPMGGVIRGHEFHYSEMTGRAAGRIRRVFRLTEGRAEGFVYKNTLATYIHLHFASNPAFAKGFVALCEKWKEENIR